MIIIPHRSANVPWSIHCMMVNTDGNRCSSARMKSTAAAPMNAMRRAHHLGNDEHEDDDEEHCSDPVLAGADGTHRESLDGQTHGLGTGGIHPPRRGIPWISRWRRRRERLADVGARRSPSAATAREQASATSAAAARRRALVVQLERIAPENVPVLSEGHGRRVHELLVHTLPSSRSRTRVFPCADDDLVETRVLVSAAPRPSPLRATTCAPEVAAIAASARTDA